MKIILATGIYPPDIGGPATYVRNLADELSRSGNDVKVVTYGREDRGQRTEDRGIWDVITVPNNGGPIRRWWRYAKTLKEVAADADIIEAFSSVSVGIPLMLARLKRPKKILRLGGDFAWERYTDEGGMLGLREWYESLRGWEMDSTSPSWLRGARSAKWKVILVFMHRLLRTFDHIIFSTRFQEEIAERAYDLPAHSVIENAFPVSSASSSAGMPKPHDEPQPQNSPKCHELHRPLRLLSFGRFVGFKNLSALVDAMPHLPGATLTFVGDGPLAARLRTQVDDLGLKERIRFLSPIADEAKRNIFSEHDLLVIPSITEISPNAALEARAEGLLVLLSKETGLSEVLKNGMVVRTLRTPQQIADAVREIANDYQSFAKDAASPLSERTWGNVVEEHVGLFRKVVAGPREESRSPEESCSPIESCPPIESCSSEESCFTEESRSPEAFCSPEAPNSPGGKKLLMVSGDRSILQGKKSAFYYTLEEFSKHWGRIDVICPSSLTPGPSPLPPTRQSGFENVFFHPSPHGLWYQPWWILGKGKELIGAFHYDVMTVHEYPPFYNGLGARWLHRVTGIPYALEIHHVVGFPFAATFAEWIGRVLSRFVLPFTARKASAVRVVNRTVKALLASWHIPEAKVHIVPSFYLDRALLQTSAATKGCGSDNIVEEIIYDVAFCGRLVANKNLPDLLRAFSGVSVPAPVATVSASHHSAAPTSNNAAVPIPNIVAVPTLHHSAVPAPQHLAVPSPHHSAVPAARLCVIGDGPERRRCEALAANLGIADRVTFAGWLPSAEKVIEALRCSRLFVMNSLSEGGPRVLLEAMAIGLPVIATPVGIVPEVIHSGVNGLITDGSVTDLQKKITLLLGDAAMRQRLGAEARKVLEQFERVTLVKTYAEFLQGLVRLSSSRPSFLPPTPVGRGRTPDSIETMQASSSIQ